jgi:hypothetical protein
MTQIGIVTTGQGETSGQSPVADGAGGFTWATPSGGGGSAVTTRNASGATAITVASSGGAFIDTLTGNTTYSAPTGAVGGTECSIDMQITQDGVGGRTLTWTGITWLSGIAPTMPTAPGSILYVSLFSLNGGSAWYGTYGPFTPAPWPNSTFGFPALGSSNTAFTANEIAVAEVAIPGAATLTGVCAQNGATGTGTIIPVLYSATGTLLASAASGIAQVGGSGLQLFAFSAPYAAAAGAYFIGLMFLSASTKVYCCYACSISGQVAGGGTTPPSTITPPTLPGGNPTGYLVPVMSTY